MLISTATEIYHTSDKQAPLPPLRWLEMGTIQAIAVADPWAAAAGPNGRIQTWCDGVEQQVIDSGINEKIHSILIAGMDPLVLLIGTEPPHIYLWSSATGRTAKIGSFDQLSCRTEWFTPWGGPAAVRSLAHGDENWIYADIHVGSIMRSADAGETWEPVTPRLDQDVHEVTTCPAAPENVYANTADAAWISHDYGDTWQHRPFPHNVTYGRAIAVHPREPACLLASVSKGPHGEDVQGRLFRSDDAGSTWTHVTAGFPAYTKENINTRRLAFDHQGRAWAAVENELYCSLDRGKSWAAAWQAPDTIEMLAT